MTSIAWDGKTLATDSRMTEGPMIFSDSCEKIFKLEDGSLVALCGDVAPGNDVIAWLNGGDQPVLDKDEDFNCLQVFPDGTAREINRLFRIMPAKAPWAGGSGEAYVMTALVLGFDAVAAVEVACRLDTKSGLPVQTGNFEENENG
jgi:hypothetical protein